MNTVNGLSYVKAERFAIRANVEMFKSARISVSCSLSPFDEKEVYIFNGAYFRC